MVGEDGWVVKMEEEGGGRRGLYVHTQPFLFFFIA